MSNTTTDITTDTLHDLAVQARDLANSLFRCPECTQQNLSRGQPMSCIQREEVRPLKPQEKKFDWTRRPFYAYSPDAMCGPCRAYYHAELAAQELHILECLGRKSASQREALEMTRLPQKG